MNGADSNKEENAGVGGTGREDLNPDGNGNGAAGTNEMAAAAAATK